jgi:transglutaminase-like putative cysteine protease
VRLLVRHITTYTYPGPVRESNNQMRLLPRPSPRQRVLREELSVTPKTHVFYSTDYFGNRVAHFSIARPHTKLVIESSLQVETLPDAPPETAEPYGLREFLLPTSLTRPPRDWGPLGQEAARLRQEAPDLQRFLWQLAAELKQRLQYVPGTTTVETTVAEVLRKGGGVCQDFAHVFIALCRWQGVAARYAGGYHFLGRGDVRHENHAWAEAYIPGHGWSGWDPANGIPAGERHVQITAGRDYDDVSPVRGTYNGLPGGTLEIQLLMEEMP